MLIAIAAVVLMLVLIVEMDALHGLFTVTNLTSAQWLVCVAVGSAILFVGEAVKESSARGHAATIGSNRTEEARARAHGAYPQARRSGHAE